MIIMYAGICASLIRLRKLRPDADALRIPLGPVLSVLAIAVSLLLLTGLKRRELLLMCVTRTDCYRKLAVGETAPLGTGNEGKRGGSTPISSLKGPHRYNRRSA
jgi:hypothetical protein